MPVFMNVWAGSWLIASVTIERTMQISSATVAEVREERADLLARLAELLEGVLRGEALQLLALELGDRLPLGERLGHRLAVHLGQLRLVVERLQVRRPAGHAQEDDPLGLRGEVQRVDDAPASGPAPSAGVAPRPRRRSAGFSERGQGQRAQAPGGPGRGRSRRWMAVADRSTVSGRSIGRWASRSRSVPGDRLVEVQEDAGHRGPGRQLGRVEVRRATGCWPTASSFARRPRRRRTGRRACRGGRPARGLRRPSGGARRRPRRPRRARLGGSVPPSRRIRSAKARAAST